MESTFKKIPIVKLPKFPKLPKSEFYKHPVVLEWCKKNGIDWLDLAKLEGFELNELEIEHLKDE